MGSYAKLLNSIYQFNIKTHSKWRICSAGAALRRGAAQQTRLKCADLQEISTNDFQHYYRFWLFRVLLCSHRNVSYLKCWNLTTGTNSASFNLERATSRY
jgi:hypothetical protein